MINIRMQVSNDVAAKVAYIASKTGLKRGEVYARIAEGVTSGMSVDELCAILPTKPDEKVSFLLASSCITQG
jgi:hypothetical protein